MDSTQQVGKTSPADGADSVEPIMLFEALVSARDESGTPEFVLKSKSQVGCDVEGNAYSNLLQHDWLVKHLLETRDASQLSARIKALEVSTVKVNASVDRYALAIHSAFSTFQHEPSVMLDTFTVASLDMVRLSETEVARVVMACCLEPSFGLTPTAVFERLRTSTHPVQYQHYHVAIMTVAMATYEDAAVDIFIALLQNSDITLTLNEIHFLQACCISRVHSETLACRLLEQYLNHLPTPHTLTQIHFKFSSYYYRCMWLKAESAFWEYVQNGAAPDDEMLGRMLQMYLQCERWDDILVLATGPQMLSSAQGHSRSLPVEGLKLDQQKVWMAMKKLVLAYACGMPSTIHWNFIFSEVIKGIVKCEGVERAHDFFDALCETEVVVEMPVYSVLLDALWQASYLVEAVRLVDQGIKRRTLPELPFQIVRQRTLTLFLDKLSPGAASAILVLWLAVIHQHQTNGLLSRARLVVIVKKLVSSISIEMKDDCFHEVVSNVDSATMSLLFKTLELPFKEGNSKTTFVISWNAFLLHMPDVRGDPSLALEKTLNELFAKIKRASQEGAASCSSSASALQPVAHEDKPCAPNTLQPDAPVFTPANILRHGAPEIKPPAPSTLQPDAPEFEPPDSTPKPDAPKIKPDFTDNLQLGAPELKPLLEPLVPGSTPQRDAPEIMKHSKLSTLGQLQKAPKRQGSFSEEASSTEEYRHELHSKLAKGSCESDVDPSCFEKHAATDVDAEMDTTQQKCAYEAPVSQCSPEAKITKMSTEEEELVAEMYARMAFLDSKEHCTFTAITLLTTPCAIL
ncbi:hypothetical protein CYMTET_29868, partial [Cymbomonas tetramitiformis]